MKQAVGVAMICAALATPAMAADRSQTQQQQTQQQATFPIVTHLSGQELAQMTQQVRVNIEQAIRTARQDAGQSAQVVEAGLAQRSQGAPMWSVQVIDPEKGQGFYYQIDANSGQVLDRGQTGGLQERITR